MFVLSPLCGRVTDHGRQSLRTPATLLPTSTATPGVVLVGVTRLVAPVVVCVVIVVVIPVVVIVVVIFVVVPVVVGVVVLVVVFVVICLFMVFKLGVA